MSKLFTIKKAGDTSITKVKALIMGESGAGKSHLIATAPNPLIILCEPNGAVSVAASNPDALIVECQTIKDVQNIYTALFKNEIDEKFDTICIDSITELQNLFIADMIESKVKAGGKREFKGFDMYGELLERTTRSIKGFMKLPYHFVCTTLCEVKEDENKERHMHPMLTGSLRYTIQSLFSGVGYLYQNGKTTDEGYSQRSLLLDGHDRIKSKAFPNTHGIIDEPNITTLFESVLQISLEEEPEPEPPKPARKKRTRKTKPVEMKPTEISTPVPASQPKLQKTFSFEELKELGLMVDGVIDDEPNTLKLLGGE